MALPESIFVIFAGATLNAFIIIGLYTRWIIPTIVSRVRDELMENIENWINSTKEDLSNTITLNIDEMRQKIVAMISGHRGNKARQLSLATEFLTANLDDPNNTDSEQAEDVLTQAIATYGEKIVKSALKSLQTTKPAAEQPPAVW